MGSCAMRGSANGASNGLMGDSSTSCQGLENGGRPMTDPDLKELFPECPDDLKPWHPLMGFGWDAVRLAEAHHYCGIAELKAVPKKE